MDLLTFLLILVIVLPVVFSLGRRLHRWIEAAWASDLMPPPSPPARPASTIRIIPPAPRTSTPRQIRILNQTHAAPTAPTSPFGPPPPAHARCTYCGRRFSDNPDTRAAYGGEYHCPDCGAYTCGHCYTKHKRCGGICRL